MRTSTLPTWSAPKRVRLSLNALLVVSMGVATADPTSSSRDCTSASCEPPHGQLGG